MKNMFRAVLFLLVLSIAAEFSAAGTVAGAGVKRVLLIDSHSSADIWTLRLRQGLQSVLSQRQQMVNYENYELGVRYQPGIVPAAADIAALRTKLASTRYDLVVASNNPAVNLFLDGTLKLPEGTPLLINGYSSPDPLAEKIPAGAEITGVATPANLLDNLRLADRLFPGERPIALITESSADGRTQRDLIHRKLPQEFASRLIRFDGDELTTPELLEKVRTLPKDAILFFHSWSSSREDAPEISYTILPKLREAYTGPIFCKYECYIDYGAFGGIIPNGIFQGKEAGELAYRILHGEKAGAIPPRESATRPVFDFRELERSGIDPALLPPGALLLNEPPDFLTRHRVKLAAGAGVLFMLLLFWVGGLHTRRRTLRRSQLLFARLPLQIAVVDRNGRVLYSHFPDPGPEEAKEGFRRLEQLPESCRELFRNSVEEAFRTGQSVRANFQTGNQYRHVEFQLLESPNLFHTRAVMWISSDMTELYHANRTMSEMAERFRLTLESIGDGVIVTDEEERVTLFNPVAARLTGHTPDEALGRKVTDVFHIVSYLDGRRVECPLHRALTTRQVVELANHTDLIAGDGTCRHIADSAAPVFDADGRIAGGVLVFRDVTEEYEKRDTLRHHSIILRNAAKIARFHYFRSDASGNWSFLPSPEQSRFWPLRNGGPVPPEEWIAPEDLGQFREDWRKLLSGNIKVLSLVYGVGSRERRSYFEMRVEESVDEINGRREFCGIIQDITHVRRTEMRYRDNLQLLETITDNLPGFLFVKDVEDGFRYLVSNRKFGELTGIDSRKIVGNFDSDVFPCDETAARKFREDDLALVAASRPFDQREFFVNSAGEQLIVRTIKHVITRSNGGRLLIGMGVDISRQYELEQEREQTIALLNNYIDSERVINQSLTGITLSETIGDAVNGMLRLIGESTGADRCYIFEYREESARYCDNRYEWVRDGIPPQIGELQRVDMELLPNWQRELEAGRDIRITDLSAPPPGFGPEAKFLAPQSIRSLLVTGIRSGGRLRGFVGLDFVREKREFSDCDLHTVHSIVNLYGLACERFRQIEKIADSVSLQRQLVDNISIPLTICDPDYTILLANRSIADEAGRPVEELLGTKCYETVCRHKVPPDTCPMRLTLQDRQSHSVENNLRDRRLISTSQPLFDRNGNFTYVLTLDIDITDINRQKEELRKAMEQAQAADRAKSYFLATVSHELRTPLNAVIGFSELLQNDNVGRAEQMEYLHAITLAGNALLNLINDVLDLSRLEADQLTMNTAPTDLAALLEEIMAVFSLKAQQKKLEFTADNSGVDGMLELDGLRLRQVILNLVGNAIKFTAAGKVSVRSEFRPDGGDGTGTLTISVSDTGIGVSPENARKIFDPFMQDTSTRGAQVYEGSGLGLAISQRLVNRMGGEIRIESVPGKGSVFTVRLEHVKAVRNAVLPAAPPEKETPDPSASGTEFRRLLLVDDVPMNLKVLQAMLRNPGIECVTASSGAEALRILDRDPAFDLILTDLWMPEMSGTEFARKLAEDSRTARIPVVVVTADARMEGEDAALFHDTLIKPITPTALARVLNRTARRDGRKGENQQ